MNRCRSRYERGSEWPRAINMLQFMGRGDLPRGNMVTWSSGITAAAQAPSRERNIRLGSFSLRGLRLARSCGAPGEVGLFRDSYSRNVPAVW